jgi:thiamine-monophosphate kinase
MSADEFDIIAKLFAPLATSAAARGLIDDVAVITAGGQMLATTDAIVEGVHFLESDPIETVAKKALRVNLSDLAAKGARCSGVLLTLIWPDHRRSSEIADFVRGLAEDLEFYKAPLLGGDTVASPGPLTVSITAFGDMSGARTPSRADAKLGEDVWVTGAIGEAWVGLEALLEMGMVAGAAGLGTEFAACIDRYRTPEPPVAFADAIAAFASASMDVSDGLLQDAAKLAAASNLRLVIAAERVPLSGETRAWLARGKLDAAAALAGGDDYQILFTAAPQQRAAIEAAGQARKLAVTRIGAVEAGAGVSLVDGEGRPLATKAHGYAHKLGK